MTNSSASRFPPNPPDEDLRANYNAMRSALVSVNISRGIFRSQSEKRGVVIAELQRGYHLNGRVLRHALVKVSMGPGPQGGAAESQPSEHGA